MVFGISETRSLRKTECRENQTLEIRNRILKRSTNRGAKLLGPNGGNVGPDFATRNETIFSGSWRPWDLKMKLRVERGSGGFAIILHSRSVRSGYLRKICGTERNTSARWENSFRSCVHFVHRRRRRVVQSMGSPHPTDVIWVARSRDSRHVKTLTILLAKIRGSAGCSSRGRRIS